VPGTLHQGILGLFRDDPWLAFDLLGIERPSACRPIDRRAEVERDAPQPLKVNPRYPDLVLVGRAPLDSTDGLVIPIEAQLRADAGKRWQLLVCQALLAEEHELPVYPVIVSFAARMSAMVRGWRTGPPPRIDALVLDRESVAPPTSAQARARPTAAILAAALHGFAGNLEAARVGIVACSGLSKTRRRLYVATILAALPEGLRTILMGELSMEETDELMEIERQSGTYQVGRRAGLEQGLEQGRQAFGRALCTILELRGVPPDDAVRRRIEACNDLSMLERWTRRAAVIERLDELFEDA
jgi:hypothetical protein